jgi:Holliday junction resolvase
MISGKLFRQVLLKPERKFWLELKEKTPNIIWNRIENLALPGIPDLLGYNKNHLFFTVELKVVKSRKVRLSPHQIAFHVKHPENSFILVKPLASRDWKLYEGKDVLELDARGLLLEARCSGLGACCSLLETLA